MLEINSNLEALGAALCLNRQEKLHPALPPVYPGSLCPCWKFLHGKDAKSQDRDRESPPSAQHKIKINSK